MWSSVLLFRSGWSSTFCLFVLTFSVVFFVVVVLNTESNYTQYTADDDFCTTPYQHDKWIHEAPNHKTSLAVWSFSQWKKVLFFSISHIWKYQTSKNPFLLQLHLVGDIHFYPMNCLCLQGCTLQVIHTKLWSKKLYIVRSLYCLILLIFASFF